jgi:predicted nucleic acid-binding protein
LKRVGSAAAGRRAEPALILAEPPPAYLMRPPLVVDCSVLSALLFEEPMRDEALRHLLGKSLHAPTLLDHEIANVAAKKQRQAWPADSIEMALAGYASLEICLHRVDIAAQMALATRYVLSAYDAAYLWLAAELKAPLATFDSKLGRAALQHLGSLK